ncbi:MAG TPA: D-TA family PLP-dependent enzyme [Pirellulales bacterium]|nr:D-TA family PLP-dependent enzyme [Pirellulales bacterium]
MSDRWYELENAAEVDSPALVVYPERVAENLRRMIAIAGGADRLRPHIKTHKMSAVVRMQVEAGITKCKCATLAEAEMAARAGATDILLAHQPVGPKIGKLAALAKRFRRTRFSTIVDDAGIARQLSATCHESGCSLDVLLDLDVGMGRSGLRQGAEAVKLYRAISRMPNLVPGGLHAYDGQIRDRDAAQREVACDAAMTPAIALRDQLVAEGLPVPRFVAGGTPTFPFHARHPDRQCSPGTCVFFDAGSRLSLPDLEFLEAAVVLSRVVSKPGKNRLCLDLGHKSVAADPVGTRVVWSDLPDATVIMHSEEHLVLETPQADSRPIGAVLYGIPWHICPTCALHAEAIVARDGRATGTWRVDARDRSCSTR